MTASKPSFLVRFFRFIVFRLFPILLIIAILWTGAGLIQTFSSRMNEQSVAQQRRDIYPQTATAMAATITPPVASDNTRSTANEGLVLASYRENIAQDAEPVLLAQFVTNTPQPDAEQAEASATPLPAGDSAPVATSTLPALPDEAKPLPTIMFLGDPDASMVDVTAIPTRVEPLDRNGNDLFNILLLGSDGEITNDGFSRTDTMIVLSINRTTNTVSMLSLPRDMFVYIPAWGMQRLNLTYARGQSGGWTDGTFELLRQTLLYNFGINVHYYAMIDLSGFKEVIDTVGGIDVAVDCAIEDLPLIGAEVPAAARRINEDGFYVLDVGYYHLTGPEALWYARSRHNSTDFDRGRRQMQILRAVWRTARDSGQLANLPALWNQGIQVVDTNLGFEDMLGLLPIALNLDPGLIESFPMVRTYHTTPWQTPSGDYVQLPVYDTMRQLLQDFYTPPTSSQIVLEGANIRVYNGTSTENLDIVAAERLGWDGLGAIAAGGADNADHTDTMLIDYKGSSKGGSRSEIARILNVKPENIIVSPDANREADFEVILGSNYSSCTFAVLPVTG